MESKKIWHLTIGLCVLAAVIGIVYWICQSALATHRRDLQITAYFDCLLKYEIAKNSGRLPSDYKLPSGSEVCAKYK